MCVTEEIELPHAAQDVIYLEEQLCQILEVKTRKPRAAQRYGGHEAFSHTFL